jgi:hypothetical protein
LAAVGVAKSLRVHNYDASTHLVIDVPGYYVPPTGYVAIDGTLISGTRLASIAHPATGQLHRRVRSRCPNLLVPSHAYAYSWVVAVGPQSGNANAAHVYIHDQTGTFDSHDTSSFIQAIC